MYLAHICLLMFACSMALGASTNTPRMMCRRTLSQARKLYCIDSTQNIRRRKQVPAPDVDFTQHTKTPPPGNQAFRIPKTPEYDAALEEEPALSDEPDYVEKCCQKPCYVTELLTNC